MEKKRPRKKLVQNPSMQKPIPPKAGLTAKHKSMIFNSKGRKDLLWLDNLANKAGFPDFDLKNIGDNWIFLEQMENLLRNLTKLYRENGQIDPYTYEDFADKLQDLIDNLRINLGIGNHQFAPLDEDENVTQLEIEFSEEKIVK